MSEDRCKDEDSEEGETDDEHVEVAIVPFPDTVPYPGTVMVESLNTVVTEGTMGCSGWTKDLASEAELQLHDLVVDHHLLRPRWRTESGRSIGTIGDLDLTLNISSFIRSSAWNDTRVREAGAEESREDEEEEESSDERDGKRDISCQERRVESEEETHGEEEQEDSDVEDRDLFGHHDPPITIEPVPARELLPPPPSRLLSELWHWLTWNRRSDQLRR